MVFGKILTAAQEINDQYHLKKVVTKVEVSIKVMEIETFRVIASKIARAERPDFIILKTNGSAAGINDFKPIYDDLAGKSVDFAVKKLADTLQPSVVIMAIDGKTVNINAGNDFGLRIDQKCDVYRGGPPLIDPTTNEVLGVQKRLIGSIKLTNIEEKMATGNIVKGKNDIAVGDIVDIRIPEK